MLVQEVLLEALLDLVDEDFCTFKWYMCQKLRDDCKPIARSHVERAKRTDIVNRLLSSYGPNTAVALSVLILQKMNKNYTAKELQDRYAAINPPGAASAVDSTPAAPAAAAAGAAPGVPVINASAVGGGVTVAPIINRGTTGTWSINISK